MTENALENAAAQPLKIGRLVLAIPMLVMLGLAVLLGIRLTVDPRERPSPLIGKAVPKFSLPPVQGRTLGISSADLKSEVSLVNVFASWCTACRVGYGDIYTLSV